MSTQYRLVQSGKTASGGCSAGQGSSELWRHGFFFFFTSLEAGQSECTSSWRYIRNLTLI
jgi:hypothetical protein